VATSARIQTSGRVQISIFFWLVALRMASQRPPGGSAHRCLLKLKRRADSRGTFESGSSWLNSSRTRCEEALVVAGFEVGRVAVGA